MANGNGNHSAAGSRRNSISKLPWPEPSPVRELPPPIPKQKVNKGAFKYYVIKEVGGWVGQMMMFDDKVGGSGLMMT